MNITDERMLLDAAGRLFGDEPVYDIVDTTDRYSYKKIAGSSDTNQTYDSTRV
ncbi:hypothetical protein ACGFX4_12170 [Kitasatospora sp. NPDC048365]|uniref:hypothetical protein n=1 Tax=Kitasatospora sp. NPDC048365 TaxID=3364050 RepID=UPI00371EF1D7